MARIALVDLAEGTVLAVRAALGAGAVEVCRRGAVPSQTPLVVLEATGSVLDEGDLGDPATPVLILADWASPAAVHLASRRFEILEKPFGSGDLRQKIRALLEPVPAAAPAATRLSEPFLEASVARMLVAARRLGGAVW